MLARNETGIKLLSRCHGSHAPKPTQNLSNEEEEKEAKRGEQVTILGLAINLALGLFKAIAGTLGNSTAMIADAVHSLTDMASDVVTLAAIRLSRALPDHDHPYGHGKFETVGALIVAGILTTSGLGIGIHSVSELQLLLVSNSLLSSNVQEIFPSLPFLEQFIERADAPVQVEESVVKEVKDIALVAAFASIIAKEFLYQITAFVAKKNRSDVLMANAWHHRSDALSSALAVLGIAGAKIGLLALDPLVGIVVSALIMKAGGQIAWHSLKELTDIEIDKGLINQISWVVNKTLGVQNFGNIRTRKMGPYYLVDLYIVVDCDMPVHESYEISETVKQNIMREMAFIREVMIDVRPSWRLP